MKYIYTMNSVEALKENVKHEKKLVEEVSNFLNYLERVENLEKAGYRIGLEEKKLLHHTIHSLVSQIRILNKALPELIGKVSFFKELPGEKLEETAEIKVEGKKRGEEKLVSFKYKGKEDEETLVTIQKNKKLRFLRELSLTTDSLKKLRKKYDYLGLKEEIETFKKPSRYARFSNKLFSKLSTNLLDKGYFGKLRWELRKANLPFLSNTYLSMAFFSSLASFFASILLVIVLLFFNLGLEYPFITAVEESVGLRLLKYFWLIIVLPVSTFFLFVFYPSLEKRAIAGKINQELPFVVIHMSAIAGSKIEPTNIFKIIVTGGDYPHSKKEIKKLLNQVNLYGYDLVSALRSSARLTSSTKLAELFIGLATTITSGGDLSEFLEKRADTLIFDFKTEKEKSTKVAETFMDIYISVVIAAPMVLTLILVMMSISPALSFGVDLKTANILMLLGIALINIIFLIFLHLKQPEF